MNIIEKLESLKPERKLARTWFMNEHKRQISLKYDERETAGIRVLSIETFLCYYYVLFGHQPTSVLDLGCGEGQSIKYLAKRIPNSKLTGIDASSDVIKTAAKRVKEAEFITADVEQLNEHLLSEKYDVIFIHLCFGLFENPLKLLKDLFMLLSDQALIYIVDLNRESWNEGINSCLSVDEEKYIHDQYNASFNKDELEELFVYVTREKELTFKVGSSLIGGFDQFSDDFFSLIKNRELQAAIKSISEEKTPETHIIPQLLHSWIIKKQLS
ncbi:class I SAM-dependent methyltransferase [Pseudobacillus badius]|uniref:class I SAM-dependent methyltransferase n=1 Tax=Bacillus badius TaxID=1455 RepID=UPI003CF56A2C